MNKKIYIFTLLMLLTGSISVMAQNLRFHDGEFKIVQFTDLHYKLGDPASRQASECIYEVVKDEDPDLIVLSGDIIYSKPGDACLQQVLNIVNDTKKPFCYMLGNHDPEQGIAVNTLYDIAQKNQYCVQPARKGNTLDYTLPIKSADGSKTEALIYCMDTHDKCKVSGVGGYQWLTSNQINSYRKVHNEYKKLNGNKALPAIMFMHYPLPEYNDAVENTQVVMYGTRMEKAYAPNLNSGMFSAIKECGDVMGVFCGHDHDNDYSLMYYKVMLAHGRYSGGNTEYNHLRNGARVIVLHENERIFDTWIHERGGNILYKTNYPESYTKDNWKDRTSTR